MWYQRNVSFDVEYFKCISIEQTLFLKMALEIFLGIGTFQALTDMFCRHLDQITIQ